MDNINDVLEKFELDPLHSLRDPIDILSEGVDDLCNLYKEAFGGTTKKNVVQKLWGFIKKIFRFMANGAKRILTFIESLFKKKTKSADQIAEEMGISHKEGSGRVKIFIRSNPQSEIKMPESLDSVFNPISFKMNEDHSITIRLRHVEDVYKGKKNSGEVPKQEMIKIKNAFNATVLINNSKLMDELVSIIKCLLNIITNKGDIKKFINLENQWDHKYFNQNISDDTTITLQQMRYFQTKLNEIMKLLETTDTIDNSIIITDPIILERLNTFSGFTANLQMGMNTISGSLQNLYQINAGYNESIRDIENLSIFIEKCIQYGFPPKYVSYNAYLISDPSLKGDGTEGDKNSPRWGQSRVVFFPKNNKKIVHKIALSGWGVRANKSEYSISKKFEDNGGSHLLALVIGKSSNSVVTSMERVEIRNITNDHPDIIGLQSQLNSFIKKNNIPLIIKDIKSNAKNVGYKNIKCVAIDYGISDRTIS